MLRKKQYSSSKKYLIRKRKERRFISTAGRRSGSSPTKARGGKDA